MKNRMKLVGIIAFVAVICLFASCGNISKDLESTWNPDDEENGFQIRMGKDEFSVNFGTGLVNIAEKVKKDGKDKIKVTLKSGTGISGSGDADIKWAVDGDKLTLSNGSSWMVMFNGKYTRKK